jgi:hypothetical protein
MLEAYHLRRLVLARGSCLHGNYDLVNEKPRSAAPELHPKKRCAPSQIKLIIINYMIIVIILSINFKINIYLRS